MPFWHACASFVGRSPSWRSGMERAETARGDLPPEFEPRSAQHDEFEDQTRDRGDVGRRLRHRTLARAAEVRLDHQRQRRACSATTASAASRRPTRSRPSRAASTSRHSSGLLRRQLELERRQGLLQRRQPRDGLLRRLQVPHRQLRLDVGALHYYYPSSGAGGTQQDRQRPSSTSAAQLRPGQRQVLARTSATFFGRQLPTLSTESSYYLDVQRHLRPRQRLGLHRPHRLPEARRATRAFRDRLHRR